MVKRAAVYARISLDRQDGAGVERQLADGLALTAENGWEPVTYVDNSMSAFQRKRRPEWQQLLTDLEAGTVDAVVGYHTDRFYRRIVELEELITLAERRPIEIATCQSGDLDLSTASGRMQARILVVFAQHESERTGERVARAKKQRASQGRPSGGGRRPFGYLPDRSALVVEEAAVLRQVAADLTAGVSWSAAVAVLNERGFRLASGAPWTVGNLRRVLTSPHVAGLRAYHGEVVGEASWPAVLDRDTWERLRADALSRRRGRPPSDRFLLTGLIVCGRCGHRMYGNGAVYRCPPENGCGKVSITRPGLDGLVTDTIRGWLADDVFVVELDRFLMYGADADASALLEREEIERRMKVLAERWGGGELSDGEYDAARAVLSARLMEVDARIVGSPRPRAVVNTAELLDMFDTADLPDRRGIIRMAARAPIEVTPGRLPPGERVQLTPAWH